jgi:hypothetical protein
MTPTKQAIADLIGSFLGGLLLSLALPIEAWRGGLGAVGLFLVAQACIPARCFRG